MPNPSHTSSSAEASGPHAAARVPSRPTPVSAIYAFSFINSLATGLVTSGIFFITNAAYQFTQLQNFALGVLLGITYIAGALGAQPAVHAIRRVAPGISSRRTVMLTMVALAVLTTLPVLVCGLGPIEPGAGGQWVIWVLIALYSPLTGLLWPMIESFLSGGRSGPELRSAIGRWNVVWSGSLVFGYFAIAPFIERAPGTAFLALGGLHLLSLFVVLRFPREPGEHHHEHAANVPPVYADLLVTFRILLPASYVVSSALQPMLPASCAAIGVPVAWQTIAASAWLLARCAGFFVLSRSEAWHGKWSAPILGGGLIVVGFALTALSPLLLPASYAPESGPHVPALAALLIGLSLFGFGMSIIYAGAIYYAMEVHAAEVEAGGMHEALIGFGYAAGPAMGVGATLAVRQGLIAERYLNALVLAGMLLVLTVAVVLVVRSVRAAHAKPAS